jgi:hypothetical protein
MVVDPYAEARSLALSLRGGGFAAWAAKLEDIVDGGATATEILMGLRWIVGQILGDIAIGQPMRLRLEKFRAAINSLLV